MRLVELCGPSCAEHCVVQFFRIWRVRFCVAPLHLYSVRRVRPLLVVFRNFVVCEPLHDFIGLIHIVTREVYLPHAGLGEVVPDEVRRVEVVVSEELCVFIQVFPKVFRGGLVCQDQAPAVLLVALPLLIIC